MLFPCTSNVLLDVAPTGIVTELGKTVNAWPAAGNVLSLFSSCTTSGAPVTGFVTDTYWLAVGANSCPTPRVWFAPRLRFSVGPVTVTSSVESPRNPGAE